MICIIHTHNVTSVYSLSKHTPYSTSKNVDISGTHMAMNSYCKHTHTIWCGYTVVLPCCRGGSFVSEPGPSRERAAYQNTCSKSTHTHSWTPTDPPIPVSYYDLECSLPLANNTMHTHSVPRVFQMHIQYIECSVCVIEQCNTATVKIKSTKVQNPRRNS